MSLSSPRALASGWQRAENLLIAVTIIVALVVWGHMWWMPVAAFLLFDLSALGYGVSRSAGAFTYNLVHNYAPPALAVTVWGVLEVAGLDAGWLALIAASWGFHVAVDRSLGFGLKLGSFDDTHLGTIGGPPPRRRRHDHRSHRDLPRGP